MLFDIWLSRLQIVGKCAFISLVILMLFLMRISLF